MADARPDFLTIQIAPTTREPEHLMLISRPDNGRVRIREWVGDGFGSPAVERECEAAELYDRIEKMSRAGRHLGQELYRVRLWLEGTGG